MLRHVATGDIECSEATGADVAESPNPTPDSRTLVPVKYSEYRSSTMLHRVCRFFSTCVVACFRPRA